MNVAKNPNNLNVKTEDARRKKIVQKEIPRVDLEINVAAEHVKRLQKVVQRIAEKYVSDLLASF